MSDILKIQVNFNKIQTKMKSGKLLKNIYIHEKEPKFETRHKKQIAKTFDILHIIV